MTGASSATGDAGEALAKTDSRASKTSYAHAHVHAHGHKEPAAIEYGYPHGHLGFLTAEEQEAFVQFKAYCQEKGYYKPGPPPSHDAPTLLRFLRARRWVVADAFQQFKETEDWRAANQINLLYDTIDLEAYEQSRLLYPQWTGRRDKRGIPVYLFVIRHLDSKTISAYEKSANGTYSKAKSDGKTPAKLLRLFALYENLTRFAQPLCTEMPDREHATTTPITLSTNIVDVSGVSLRQFWNLKSHMQAASTLATAHYPETLDRIFIIGAPMFFSTVWGWIKRWFDPVTVSKIFILGHHEVLPTLQSFIEPRNIPKIYGGELEFNWGEQPNLDPAIQQRATWANGLSDFPEGPKFWRPVDGADLVECFAAGSIKQVERMERVCTLPKVFQGEAAVVPEEETGAVAKPLPVEAKTAADKTAPPVAEMQGLAVSEKVDGKTKAAGEAQVDVAVTATPTTAS